MQVEVGLQPNCSEVVVYLGKMSWRNMLRSIEKLADAIPGWTLALIMDLPSKKMRRTLVIPISDIEELRLSETCWKEDNDFKGSHFEIEGTVSHGLLSVGHALAKTLRRAMLEQSFGVVEPDDFRPCLVQGDYPKPRIVRSSHSLPVVTFEVNEKRHFGFSCYEHDIKAYPVLYEVLRLFKRKRAGGHAAYFNDYIDYWEGRTSVCAGEIRTTPPLTIRAKVLSRKKIDDVLEEVD